MGKNKNKDDGQNPNNIPNKDILQRLNFLYQASVLMHKIASPSDNPDSSTPDSGNPRLEATQEDNSETGRGRHERNMHKSNGKQQRMGTASDLARNYIRSMRIIGQKTNVRMDPSVKRSLCKGCSTVLVPGSTATVRIKSMRSHRHAISYTCTHCSTTRRIPAPPTAQPMSFSSPNSNRNTPKLRLNEESGMDGDIRMANEGASGSTGEGVENSEEKIVTMNSGKRRLHKHRKVIMRSTPFFARDDHIVIVGNGRTDTAAQ
ncbi:Rpr2-domain-containing protein [Rickenella mellea]|uniref:Rpr2-domain-containing protein n=1 Tax=Rickenella mellea TaxID=50990 RepID=A0A4Y7QAX3_9AGAM|nr:Rpr2-domain-containing protein [Rickenella mellea]